MAHDGRLIVVEYFRELGASEAAKAKAKAKAKMKAKAKTKAKAKVKAKDKAKAKTAAWAGIREVFLALDHCGSTDIAFQLDRSHNGSWG